jgi:spermidine synthase
MISFCRIKSLTSKQEEEVKNLYRDAGWWFASDEKKLEMIARIVAGSWIFCIAIKNDEILAIGRVISDGVSDAYIQDITVRSDSRKQGIGTALVEFIIRKLTEEGFSWIGLIATPESERIYKRIGFKEMTNNKAMILRFRSAPGQDC